MGCGERAQDQIDRGAASFQQGDYDAAIDDFSEAIRLNPNSAIAYNNRGFSWARKGAHEKAINDYSEAIRHDPTLTFAYFIRATHGSITTNTTKPSQIIRLLYELAWIQATCPDAGFRNGQEALRYATKACELTEWKDGFCIAVLAAAHAESGDFDEAFEWQKKSMNLAPEEEMADCRTRLELYKSGKPYWEE